MRKIISYADEYIKMFNAQEVAALALSALGFIEEWMAECNMILQDKQLNVGSLDSPTESSVFGMYVVLVEQLKLDFVYNCRFFRRAIGQYLDLYNFTRIYRKGELEDIKEVATRYLNMARRVRDTNEQDKPNLDASYLDETIMAMNRYIVEIESVSRQEQIRALQKQLADAPGGEEALVKAQMDAAQASGVSKLKKKFSSRMLDRSNSVKTRLSTAEEKHRERMNKESPTK